MTEIVLHREDEPELLFPGSNENQTVQLCIDRASLDDYNPPICTNHRMKSGQPDHLCRHFTHLRVEPSHSAMQISNYPRQPDSRNFWRGRIVQLRAIEQKDLEALLTSPEELDTEIERFEDAIGFPRSSESERDNLQKLAKRVGKEDFLFCLVENNDGQTVGHINSFDCVRRNGTFKYALAIKHQFWRNGYGREAATIFLRYYFRELRYQKCTALVYEFNEASIRFHEALGFRFEGRLRNMLYTNGQYFDELYFGVTAAEWDQIDPVSRLGNFRSRYETGLNPNSGK